MAAIPGRKFVINLIGESKGAEDAFKNVGRAAGRLPGPVGLATAAIAASFVAVIAVVGKVTKELFDLGEVFNDSFRTIRVGTGVTGEAFGELQDSFRNVAKNVPNDLGDVATAIAELNTRTGATGPELEALALEFLTVSRLLGGDVQSNIRSVTRLFGDFGVEGKDQVDVMNLLFRASQMTGASFDTLADQTVQYGARLRNLGFTLPESIALLGSFEKNGVNLETVMAGLNIAVVKLGQSGKPLAQALSEVIVEIQTMEDATAANALAVETFGQRAGGDLVDAIRSGRLSVGELVEAIVEGSDTINAAADDTDGFREAWEGFKNYIKITLEPVATEVFKGLKEVVAELRPAADEVVKAFQEDGLEGALEQLAIEWDKIYTSKIEPLWLKFLTFLDEVVKPLAIQIGKEIGLGIANAIAQAALDALVALGSAPANLALELLTRNPPAPPPNARQPGESVQDYHNRRMASASSSPRGSLQYPSQFVSPFADGGLVRSPVMGLVGEAGPEVIIPLDRFEQQYGSGRDIYITVNGALDAEGTARTILRTLQDAERRTGVRLSV